MKERLWDRIHRGMDAGFDAAVSAVHTITEKAGEGVELTRLRREKVRRETELTKLLAELGNAVFEKISADRLGEQAKQLGIQDLIVRIADREARMEAIDNKLGAELTAKEHRIL